MLDPALKTSLTAYLERLVRPIELVATLDDSQASREVGDLLSQIATLSPKIKIIRDTGAVRGGDPGRQHDLASGAPGAPRVPSFAVRPAAEPGEPPAGARVTFAGVPLGHEFTSLVLALLQVGGYPPKVDAELLERAAGLPGEGELRFETFFSLSCQNCPDVVQALNLLAVVNPRVTHVGIDGALFRSEVEARQVMAVPSVFLNGEPFAQGRMDLAQILAKLDTGSSALEAERLRARAPYDVLVVGGGPAGAAAAIYAARKGIRTGVLAERFGGQLLDTMGIENFVSVRQTEGPQMAVALEQHVRDYDVDVMNLQRAEALVPAREPGGLVELRLANGASLQSRTVVLSTGARWRSMNVPGEAEYRNRGVAYCPHCDGPLFKGKRVAVIGGGNSGVEAAIDLAGLVAHVTLIEFDAKLRADEVLQRKLRSLPNATVILAAQTTEVAGDGQKVTGLVYRDRASGAERHVELEGVFVQIGLLPNTEWLRGTVALSPRGEILVDERGQASVPGVFAAGDATTVPYKQIVIAMGAGATAALSAFDYLIRTSAPATAARAA